MKLLSSILFSIVLASSVFAQGAAVKQISAKITEIENQLTTQSVSPDLKTQCTKDIAGARASLKSGRALLSLYTMRDCQIELARLLAKPAVSKSGSSAYVNEKQKFESERTKTDKLPSIAIALSDVALLEAEHQYQSSKLPNGSAQNETAVDFLAKACATLDFANFVLGLRLPEPKSVVELKSLEPELTKLGTAAMRTYKAAGGTAQQPVYGRLKSTIELAVELNGTSKFEAALFKYLEAELYFGLIVTAAENEDLQHLRERSNELNKSLTSGKTDNSVGVLFSEIAETNLNPGSSAPTQMQTKTAVVVLNRVLPGYFDYLKRIGPPSPPQKQKKDKLN